MRLAPLPSAPAGPPPPRLGCPHDPSPQREAGGLKPSRGRERGERWRLALLGAARPRLPALPPPPLAAPLALQGGEGEGRREAGPDGGVRGGRAAPVTRCVAAQGYAVGRESVK